MLLVYTPAEGEPEEFVFRPLEIDNLDAEDLEEVGGNVWDDFDEFSHAFHQGKTRALRAALWVCLRAKRPELEFDQVRFKVNEVDILLQADEQERIRQSLHDGALTIEQAAQAEALLSAQRGPEGKGEAGDGDTNST